MKRDIPQNDASPEAENANSTASLIPGSTMHRRKFVEMVGAGALAFTILPRHVLGGKNLCCSE